MSDIQKNIPDLAEGAQNEEQNSHEPESAQNVESAEVRQGGGNPAPDSRTPGENASQEGQNEGESPKIPDILPVLPLHDCVVFNSMIVPLFEGREKCIETVEYALNGDRFLLLCALSLLPFAARTSIPRSALLIASRKKTAVPAARNVRKNSDF